MKTFIKIYTVLLLSLIINTQISAQRIGDLNGINYQAVAIDENGKEIVGMDITGKPLYEKEIGVRFSILKGKDGAIQYQETHTALTDQYGLFSLTIGHGTQTGSGAYSNLLSMPWIDADQWLKVEIAIRNDGNFKVVSLQQFMSVPYSFYTHDIADDAITTEKILNETILAEDIATGAVTTDEILNGTILNEDIADGTIDLTSKVTGILPVTNGGTGLDGSLVADGQLLIGNGTDGDYDIANLTPGIGIIITNTPGGIQISSGVEGINSTIAGSINVGTADPSCPGGRSLGNNVTWISPAIPIEGVQLGNIVVGSLNYPLSGCMMTTSVENENIIKVTIYNGTGDNVCFGTGLELRILIVQ